jgi:hypothetical protein
VIDAAGSDAGSDASPDVLVQCTLYAVPECAIECGCAVGIPASCFPPGSINEYGAIDLLTCTAYCPTDTATEGSWCSGAGRTDGGTYIMSVDSGTDAWVYCHNIVCIG